MSSKLVGFTAANHLSSQVRSSLLLSPPVWSGLIWSDVSISQGSTQLFHREHLKTSRRRKFEFDSEFQIIMLNKGADIADVKNLQRDTWTSPTSTFIAISTSTQLFGTPLKPRRKFAPTSFFSRPTLCDLLAYARASKLTFTVEASTSFAKFSKLELSCTRSDW